jgi:hypothetical protein
MISLPPGPLARNDSRRDSSSEIIIKEGYNRMGDNMQRATGSFGRVASYKLQTIRCQQLAILHVRSYYYNLLPEPKGARAFATDGCVP